MPIYSEEVVQKVRESNDIVEVISDYITLKRAGVNFKALCPFHNEKTPSFMVSSSKQIFHCFGCGEGGDVIGFVMKFSNLDFIEAVELLADRAGIVLEKNISNGYKEINDKKNRLFQINKDAAKYFYFNLKQNNSAYQYLINRGISSNTIKTFGLGFSKKNWDDLLKFLKSKGYDEKEIEEVGLIIKSKKNNGYYDRFRNRVMYPIFDVKGRIIGFGGRVLDNSLPKYLNSPDSPVFSKGNNLYGLNIAKQFSREKNMILVEGYMDVISLYNHGVKHSVASLGTAFTEQQAKLLKRYSEKFYICYDSDTAGLKATDKAFDIFKKLELKAKAIILPKGKDPDDYIRERGKEALKMLTKNSLDYIDFKIYLFKQRHNLSSTEGKINFTKEISSLLSQIKSPVEVDAYITKISEETKLSIDAIKSEIFRTGNNYSPKTISKDKYIYNKYRDNNIDRIIPVKSKLEPGYLDAEKRLLNLIINDKNIFNKIKDNLTPLNFLNESHRKIASEIYKIYEEEEIIIFDNLAECFNDEDLKTVSSIKALDVQLDGHEKEKAVEDFINKIKYNNLKIKKDNIKKQIEMIENKKEKTKGDEEQFKQLCSVLININRDLKFHR